MKREIIKKLPVILTIVFVLAGLGVGYYFWQSSNQDQDNNLNNSINSSVSGSTRQAEETETPTDFSNDFASGSTRQTEEAETPSGFSNDLASGSTRQTKETETPSGFSNDLASGSTRQTEEAETPSGFSNDLASGSTRQTEEAETPSGFSNDPASGFNHQIEKIEESPENLTNQEKSEEKPTTDSTVEQPEPVIEISLGKPIGDIAPLAIKGVNHGIIMQIVGFEKELAKLNFGSLRFPPGNIADDNPLDKNLIDAFKGHWTLLGELPVLVIANLFKGSPEEAAEAARYFRELEIPIVAWEIGNEPDLYAYNRGDPSWTPEKYCERLRAFRESIKAVDSEYLMAGPGTSGAGQGSPPELYLKEVLKLCGDAIDIFTWHIYPTDGSKSDEEALATYSVITQTIERYRAWLKDSELNPLGYEKATPIGITEFGLSWKTDVFRHLFDMVATLWLADALGQMATQGLDYGYYFALKDIGGHGLIDVIGIKRPTYYVFEMLADFEGQVLEIQGTTPDLHAYAAKSENSVQILLVNISKEAISVKINPSEYNLGKLAITTLSENTYAKYYDFESEIGYEFSEQAAGKSVSIPAHSVALVRSPIDLSLFRPIAIDVVGPSK